MSTASCWEHGRTTARQHQACLVNETVTIPHEMAPPHTVKKRSMDRVEAQITAGSGADIRTASGRD